MPSKTKKQARAMAWAAHSKEGAQKTGIPQSVAKDFNREDQNKGKMKKGASRKR
jgi:hypothetical protein